MKPIGIQRKRTKGWLMPPNTVCVDRSTMYGNPYKTAKEYEDWLMAHYNNDKTNYYHNKFIHKRNSILTSLSELRNKNLACWCPLDKDCHRNILLKLANK